MSFIRCRRSVLPALRRIPARRGQNHAEGNFAARATSLDDGHRVGEFEVQGSGESGGPESAQVILFGDHLFGILYTVGSWQERLAPLPIDTGRTIALVL
jgi:hypothetical protein